MSRLAKYTTIVHASNRNVDYGTPVTVYAANKQEAVNRAVYIGWGGDARDARVTVRSVEDVLPQTVDQAEDEGRVEP